MKRVFAILLALVMVFSLSITAFATGENGSITITNATPGEDYALYKIFDASVKLDADGKVEAVAYSIDPDENDYFAIMFGEDGTTANEFFTYNPNATTGNILVNESATQEQLIDYLTKLVTESDVDPIQEVNDFQLHPVENDEDPTDDDDLVFSGLDSGYYLIISSLGTAVTINSNTPHVKVIDKNQEPGTNFDKQVQLGVDEDGNPIWGDANSASIGDKVNYRISVDTTNYDGDKKIKYYQFHDEKGDSIWVEFNSIEVFVGDKELPRGYYLSQGGLNTNNWLLLGDEDKGCSDGWDSLPEAERTPENAQWFLVHLGYDKFRITIPWLEDHTLKENKDTQGNVVSYTLTFAEDAEPIYQSPNKLEVTYRAAVEANAAIGGTDHGNRFNKAHGSWTSENETGNTPEDQVVTSVYGIGLLKDDSQTGKNLAGATFAVYGSYSEDDEGNAVYDDPIYVIPTGIDGVYAIDSLGTDLDGISGDHKQTTRTYYQYLRDPEGNFILTDENDPESKVINEALVQQGTKQTNEVVSQANGKLAILGLEAGEYYLIETVAPEGYNALQGHLVLKAGEGARPFVVYADKEGNVADIQSEDATHDAYTYELTHTVVHNSKGAVLPSTGGKGAIMLITIGSMVAMGFAVLLITQKKMSIYRD